VTIVWGSVLRLARQITQPLRRSLAKAIYSRADDSTQTDYQGLAFALLSGRPYFGRALMALQGDPTRQKHFRPVVESISLKLERPLDVLEIGSWAGSSALAWVSAIRESKHGGTLTCVDQWKAYASVPSDMNAATDDDMIYRLFLHNMAASGIRDFVRIVRGDSREILKDLPPASFDIVYIDGDHSYETVRSDIEQARRLVRTPGVVCGDDLECQRHEISNACYETAISRDSDYITLDGNSFHPGVTRAVAEQFGPVPAWNGFWAVTMS
jgi:predicted O-methyltransferase YrrM